ncbi:MFS transporter [Fibrobacter sp. UWH6]|uniref:MFS transporter n=1 Tax=Fibrobacter sp. (strain UWH6) TaxID=1896212 RepID=UPI0009192B9C|nr:MFS transporter [Fibrobacter sp. UWH6]SHK82069.1 acyl-[acyl-carrier-protein]-phospholipid O-acyltransferase / long-chain-fatty-acid--[acyl-carrier-protein] ligase [Fibrobacter sp. UWH6]
MKLYKYHGAIPFFFAVFFGAFTQMGIFVHFQAWLSANYQDTAFLWRSLLLQVGMFVPSIFMMPIASYFVSKQSESRAMGWSSIIAAAALIAISVCYVTDCNWVAFGLVGVYGIGYALHVPARLSAMQKVFDGSDLVKANAWFMIYYVLGVALAAYLGFIGFNQILFIYLGASVATTIFSFFVRVGRRDESIKYRSASRVFTATWKIPSARLAILGLSAFWGVIQILMLLAQHMSSGSANNAFSLTLAGFVFTVTLTAAGIIVGAVMASRSSKGFVETGIIPFAAIASALVMFLIPFVHIDWLQGILYSILGISTGAAFVILRTTTQNLAKTNTAGRIHSVSNMIQMIVLTVLTGGQTLLLIFTDCQVYHCFLILSVMFIITFILTLRSNPMTLLRAGLRFAFSYVFRYRIMVKGSVNIPESGPALLVGPHFSYIDWAVLQMASPRPLRIASNRNTFADWYQRWLFHGKFLIPINRRDPKPAMEEIRQALLNGEVVVIFPEGEVSKSPFISKFTLDYSAAVKDTGAQIIPFYIQGLWGSRYSHASECVNRPQYYNRIVSVGFSKALTETATEEQIRADLQALSADVWNVAMDHSKPIVPLWFRAMRKRRNRPILIDPAGKHVSGHGMLRLCHRFGGKIRSVSKGERHIGFMLPTSRDAALGIMSILGTGKTSVNLNYTAPVDTVLGCIEKAEISTVVTTRAFLTKLSSKNPAFEEIANRCKMIYLDDEEEKLGSIGRILDAAKIKFLPAKWLKFLWFTSAKPNDDALILFSSGSEGTPKGVQLTHKNIVSNAQQMDYIIKMHRGDVMTCLLPLFHSFGFTMTFMAPMLNGVPMVLCPDPTDIKTLARVCAQYKTTILMGTPTFLRAIVINRWVHPMCLDSLRYIVAGAEKLRPEMREAFKLKFGKDIYEAYGCTELSPLATLNAPNVLLDDFLTMGKCNDTSSIGLGIPGSITAIIDPETNEFLEPTAEGMIVVSGPQVMKGYLKDPEKTASVVFEKDGRRWYKTGDKGTHTPDGFVQILGRYSRFAKLGGEMISLTAVELRLAETKLLEGMEFAVTAVPDSVKGERIVLLVNGQFDVEELSRNIRKSGIPPLMIPGSVFKVDSIPKLGSGKWDFTNMKKLAIELMEGTKK